jgi:hypothetical protein
VAVVIYSFENFKVFSYIAEISIFLGGVTERIRQRLLQLTTLL